MLSQRELARVARVLVERLPGGHLDRVVQRDGARLELTLSRRGVAPRARERCHLVLSADPQHAHVGEAERFAPAPSAPGGFAQLLRAHAGRARVAGVEVVPGERQLEIALGAVTEPHRLVLQILGPRSNVYLLGARREILGSLRPLVETRRDLAVGAPLSAPATPPLPPGTDRFETVSDAELLRAIESRYATAEREARAETLARRIARALAREQQRLLRREASTRRDLAKERPSDVLRREGELLKGALREIVPGAPEVRLRDWETGQRVVISLDPALSAARNLEKRFAAYRRALRREEAAASQLASIGDARAALARLDQAFEAITGAAALRADALATLAGRPEMARLLARHPLPGARPRPPGSPRARRGASPPARLRPARYRTSDGLEVWVGRSAAGNDHLTTRLARGRDLFLHVEGSPGSHVVLRTAGRTDAPQASLLEAAELAVHFSKLRHAARAELRIAPIRDVHKPVGAAPGLVHVLRGRTLSLRRDASRLARVLDARIDEPDGAGWTPRARC